MKIVLADPPVFEKRYDNSYPNVGLLYIISFLRKEIPDANITYLESHCNIDKHIEILNQLQPDIYGLSFTSKTLNLAIKTVKEVKKHFPDLTIVVGGAHATALPRETLQDTQADIVVKGEGEAVFADLVRTIRNRGDLKTVEGIVYRSEGQIHNNANRAYIKHLDEIPFPAWDIIDYDKYPGMHVKMQSKESSLVISRGCPYDCTFCSNPVWKNGKPWLRYRSSDSIIQEIEYLYSLGIREIYFSSDEMNFNLTWAKDLLNKIIALDHKDLYFQCNLRVDRIESEFARMLKDAKVWLIHLGMESANNRVLKGLKKMITVEQTTNATNLLSKHGIKIFGFMMLYNVWEEHDKLCYETSEEVDITINYCKHLLKHKRIHYMSWQFCTPLPGARLYNIAKKHNIMVDEDKVIWDRFDEHYIAMKLPGISHKEMMRKIKRGILIKDWYMLKSGKINLSHLWRARENLSALFRKTKS